MTLSPEWIGLLLWVLGLFMGGGAAMVYGRRSLAEARSRGELVRTQYEARISDYETRIQQLDRQLAGYEAELRSLRERLDEARDAVNDKSLEIGRASCRERV